MTTLAKMSGPVGVIPGRQAASSPCRTSSLVTRLQAECDRQMPFSGTRQLLREAACAIERLEAEVARSTAELAAGRATRQVP